MPYIAKSEKGKVGKGLLALHLSELTNAGALKLCDSPDTISQKYISQNNESYQTYNDIVGVLDFAKMELYLRLILDYEDKKMTQNKDVPPYDKMKEKLNAVKDLFGFIGVCFLLDNISNMAYTYR